MGLIARAEPGVVVPVEGPLPDGVLGEISLCQSAMFIQRQGLLASFADAPGKLPADVLQPLLVSSTTCYGALKTLGPVLEMSETPPRWARPTPELGGDAPAWLPR